MPTLFEPDLRDNEFEYPLACDPMTKALHLDFISLIP